MQSVVELLLDLWQHVAQNKDISTPGWLWVSAAHPLFSSPTSGGTLRSCPPCAGAVSIAACSCSWVFRSGKELKQAGFWHVCYPKLFKNNIHLNTYKFKCDQFIFVSSCTKDGYICIFNLDTRKYFERRKQTKKTDSFTVISSLNKALH